MVDIATPGVAAQLAKRIANDIDEYIINSYDGGHRWHLGGSQIGEDCKRKLWYIFRWCFRDNYKKPDNHARMIRLFNRGHREEERFIEWLEGIGAEVWSHDENGEQFKISAVNGHFGGSLDGICKLPPSYGIDEKVLLEFKTSGTGSAFNKTVENGMAVEKPTHYAQTSVYGSDPKYNLRYCLYFIINKNDDSLHIELVKLDHDLGKQLRKKAELIILSDKPPQRISENPTFFTCKFCHAHDICHKGELPARNCRSCKHSKPVENAEWYCEVWNNVIPRDFVPKGCDRWESITK